MSVGESNKLKVIGSSPILATKFIIKMKKNINIVLLGLLLVISLILVIPLSSLRIKQFISYKNVELNGKINNYDSTKHIIKEYDNFDFLYSEYLFTQYKYKHKN